jgi:uncharacterized membrane-anchored protein YitT (DUF2179 family)
MGLRKMAMRLTDLKRGTPGGAVALTPPVMVRGWRHLLIHRRIQEWLTDVTYVAAGCLVFVIGMNALLIPHQLIAGGLTGVALLLHYTIPFFNVGWWYFFLNIPLLWLGWRSRGRRFMLLTAFGMLFFSLAANWVSVAPFAVYDPITAAIAAGVICGLGAGLVLRSRGSAGGLDILSIYFRDKFGFSLGALGFAMNGAILLAGAWFHDLQTALYSAIFIFVCARVVDAVLVGVNPQKIVMVISDRSEDIAHALMVQMKYGVTFLQGEGGFARQEKKIICSVVRLMDVPRFKACALGVDAKAMLVVNDTCEVAGQRTFAGITRAAGCQEGIATTHET